MKKPARRKSATRRTVEARTFASWEDDHGGRVTFHREDGYLAWVGSLFLNDVMDVEEGQRMIADWRRKQHAGATSS